MGRLQGKIAIVTGLGGPGMGRAAAIRFAREGATIVGSDINEAGVDETVRLVEEAGGTIHALKPLDMLLEESAAKLVDFAVEKAGGVDILYNNVSFTRTGFSTELTQEQFNESVLGSLTPSWMMSKHVRPVMARRGGGSIVNIASMIGTASGTGMLGNANYLFAYGLSKAGVVRLTEQMAVDLAPDGIRVNCISPGSILPVSRVFADQDGGPINVGWIKGMLIRRLGQPDDVVNAALYFASDESSYVTGQNLTVDGGWTVGGGHGWPDGDMLALMRAASRNHIQPIPEQYQAKPE